MKKKKQQRVDLKKTFIGLSITLFWGGQNREYNEVSWHKALKQFRNFLN